MFGRFSLSDPEGNAIKLATVKAAQIVALLVMARTHSLGRDEMADLLWPDVDPESQKTSLRTALSQLRRAVGDDSLVEADRDAVWLKADAWTSDLTEALRLRRMVQLMTVEADQVTPLEELADVIDEPLLANWNESWVESARREWTERWLRSLKALQSIAEKHGRWEDMLDMSERVLRRIPYDESSIARAMRAEAGMGNPEHALKRFQRSEDVIRQSVGRHASDALRSVYEGIKSGKVRPAPDASMHAGSGNDSMLSSAFFGWLESNPDAALGTLNEMLYSPIGNRQPAASWEIMERALSMTDGTSEPRMRAAAVCAWFAMQSEKLQECTHWNEFILTSRPAGHPQTVNAYNRLGVVAYYRGQLEEARRCHEKALTFAQEQKNEFMTAMSLVNLRNLDILSNKPEGTVDEFESVIQQISQLPNENPLLLIAPIRSFQAIACLARGDWPNALRLGKMARDVADVCGVSNFGAESLGWMGIAQFQMGDRQIGLGSMLEAVREAIQQEYVSASERLIRLAGAMIASSGRPQEGADLIEATNSFCLGRGIRAFPADVTIISHIHPGKFSAPKWREGTRSQLHADVLTALSELIEA